VTEDRPAEREGGRQKAEGRRQKAEGGRQKAEGGRQKAAIERHGEGVALLPLANVASVRRGITTGANEFFYLSRAETKTNKARRSRNGLTAVRDSVGEIREIESSLLSPVVFSL